MKEREKGIKGRPQDYWLTQLCGWRTFNMIRNIGAVKSFAEIWYFLFDMPV